ncbi:MAG TPA: dTDP-4-dehydrorhamnose 3,5-epimerase family protein [Bryobacteraceae bacterium]|nr:dTDP-4-dehydrorhamnose 3,5-epimerase family protein [Bryobacteraceae bacterium]
MIGALLDATLPELVTPSCEKGIGRIILAPDSKDLIWGVQIQPYPVWPDDRGYFLEVARIGQGLVQTFSKDSTQISAALSYPGTIKAFHFHRYQTDCWMPVEGMLQVALVDLRKDSATFGVRNTLYLGTLRRWQLFVPPGIAHGYKVIGPGPAMLVYLTNRFYDPADEGRIPYNDPLIQYDWELQHK